MKPAVARVDQRLIHGQVCVGWVPVFGIRRLLVADDVVAGDDFERDVVTGAAPTGVAAVALPVAEAAAALARDDEPTMVLVRSPAAMLALIEAGAPIDAVNVGGLHYREGARWFLDYVYLTPEDVGSLQALHERGVKLTARDLPGSSEVDLNPLLASGELTFDRLAASDRVR